MEFAVNYDSTIDAARYQWHGTSYDFDEFSAYIKSVGPDEKTSIGQNLLKSFVESDKIVQQQEEVRDEVAVLLEDSDEMARMAVNEVTVRRVAESAKKGREKRRDRENYCVSLINKTFGDAALCRFICDTWPERVKSITFWKAMSACINSVVRHVGADRITPQHMKKAWSDSLLHFAVNRHKKDLSLELNFRHLQWLKGKNLTSKPISEYTAAGYRIGANGIIERVPEGVAQTSPNLADTRVEGDDAGNIVERAGSQTKATPVEGTSNLITSQDPVTENTTSTVATSTDNNVGTGQMGDDASLLIVHAKASCSSQAPAATRPSRRTSGYMALSGTQQAHVESKTHATPVIKAEASQTQETFGLDDIRRLYPLADIGRGPLSIPSGAKDSLAETLGQPIGDLPGEASSNLQSGTSNRPPSSTSIPAPIKASPAPSDVSPFSGFRTESPQPVPESTPHNVSQSTPFDILMTDDADIPAPIKASPAPSDVFPFSGFRTESPQPVPDLTGGRQPSTPHNVPQSTPSDGLQRNSTSTSAAKQNVSTAASMSIMPPGLMDDTSLRDFDSWWKPAPDIPLECFETQRLVDTANSADILLKPMHSIEDTLHLTRDSSFFLQIGSEQENSTSDTETEQNDLMDIESLSLQTAHHTAISSDDQVSAPEEWEDSKLTDLLPKLLAVCVRSVGDITSAIPKGHSCEAQLPTLAQRCPVPIGRILCSAKSKYTIREAHTDVLRSMSGRTIFMFYRQAAEGQQEEVYLGTNRNHKLTAPEIGRLAIVWHEQFRACATEAGRTHVQNMYARYSKAVIAHYHKIAQIYSYITVIRARRSQLSFVESELKAGNLRIFRPEFPAAVDWERVRRWVDRRVLTEVFRILNPLESQWLIQEGAPSFFATTHEDCVDISAFRGCDNFTTDTEGYLNTLIMSNIEAPKVSPFVVCGTWSWLCDLMANPVGATGDLERGAVQTAEVRLYLKLFACSVVCVAAKHSQDVMVKLVKYWAGQSEPDERRKRIGCIAEHWMSEATTMVLVLLKHIHTWKSSKTTPPVDPFLDLPKSLPREAEQVLDTVAEVAPNPLPVEMTSIRLRCNDNLDKLCADLAHAVNGRSAEQWQVYRRSRELHVGNLGTSNSMKDWSTLSEGELSKVGWMKTLQGKALDEHAIYELENDIDTRKCKIEASEQKLAQGQIREALEELK